MALQKKQSIISPVTTAELMLACGTNPLEFKQSSEMLKVALNSNIVLANLVEFIGPATRRAIGSGISFEAITIDAQYAKELCINVNNSDRDERLLRVVASRLC